MRVATTAIVAATLALTSTAHPQVQDKWPAPTEIPQPKPNGPPSPPIPLQDFDKTPKTPLSEFDFDRTCHDCRIMPGTKSYLICICRRTDGTWNPHAGIDLNAHIGNNRGHMIFPSRDFIKSCRDLDIINKSTLQASCKAGTKSQSEWLSEVDLRQMIYNKDGVLVWHKKNPGPN